MNLDSQETLETCALGYVLSGVRADLHPLDPELFTTPKARKIAEAVKKSENGSLLTAMDTLSNADYKAVGEMEGLQEIEAAWKLYGVGGADEVLRLLEEKREDRRINGLCLEIIDRVRNKQPYEDLQQQLTRRSVKANFTPLPSAVSEGLAFLDDVRTGKIQRIPLALAGLEDEYTLRPGYLVIWAARVKQGKTAGALQLAYRLSTLGHGVCFYSLEMPAYQLGLRVLSQVAGVSVERIAYGKLGQKQADDVNRVTGDFMGQPNPIRLVDNVRYDEQLYAHIRAQSREGVKVFFVDYLGLVRPSKREGTQEREIANLTGNLKQLAVELGVVIVLLAQINRESTKGQVKPNEKDPYGQLRPQVHQIKGSGAIEADADLILLFWRYPDEYGLSTDEGEIIVGANRHGDTGVYQVKFHGAVMRYERA